VRRIPVEEEADAEGLPYLRSPTVLVEGLDVDPAARGATPTGPG